MRLVSSDAYSSNGVRMVEAEFECGEYEKKFTKHAKVESDEEFGCPWCGKEFRLSESRD